MRQAFFSPTVPRQLAANRQQGFSLLEVLVALLITTVGLVGFAALQTRALLAAEDTYVRTQAMSLAQELLERRRINGATQLAATPPDPTVEATVTAAYTSVANWTSAIPTQNCFSTLVTCTPAQMALYDIAELRRLVSTNNILPNGSMMATQNAGNGMLNIYVAWGDDTAVACAAANGQAGGLARRNCVVLEGI
ncbi:MAG: type IV pilus modification protein PilV [Moraxellaceae bacterium]|nr:type IV pilus modification protein PilV [Moraxellaceae bacterium]